MLSHNVVIQWHRTANAHINANQLWQEWVS